MQGYNAQQSQGYGAPQQQQAKQFDFATIKAKLEKMVFENKLQHFYPPQRLDQVAHRVSQQNVAGLGRQWRLPAEVTVPPPTAQGHHATLQTSMGMLTAAADRVSTEDTLDNFWAPLRTRDGDEMSCCADQLRFDNASPVRHRNLGG